MDLLKVKEAAAELHISVSYAYVLARRGVIPTVRIGGAIRVPRWALDSIRWGKMPDSLRQGQSAESTDHAVEGGWKQVLGG